MTCLCVDDLRPASFRGVGFWVSQDKESYGRRIVTHEYPMRDKPYNEDLGEKAQKISVTAYLFGDDWISQKEAIVQACRARGPAMLQLPTESPKMVVCNTLSVSRTKDECGFYSLSMEFTVEQPGGAPFLSGVAELQIGAVFDAAVSVLTRLFDRKYEGENALEYVFDNATARLSRFTEDVIASVEGNPSTDPELSTDIIQAAITLYQNAETVVQPDPTSPSALDLVKATTQYGAMYSPMQDTSSTAVVENAMLALETPAAAVVPVVASIIRNMAKTMLVDDVIDTMTYYSSWSVAETKLPPTVGVTQPRTIGPSEHADIENGAVFCGVVRAFALMKLAQAISVKGFRSRQEAMTARANIVELFNMQIAQFDEDEIVNLMLAARDIAVQAVSHAMASLVAVLTINAPLSKPSLYWANRLYGDAYRAEELADRNHVKSPGFMPINFEALAR